MQMYPRMRIGLYAIYRYACDMLVSGSHTLLLRGYPGVARLGRL